MHGRAGGSIGQAPDSPTIWLHEFEATDIQLPVIILTKSYQIEVEKIAQRVRFKPALCRLPDGPYSARASIREDVFTKQVGVL